MFKGKFNIFILTGAGISAESGLATFCAENGLWAGHKIRDICTPEALAQDADKVCRFYDERKLQAANATPNAAHKALAEFEHFWRANEFGNFLLVTQNVDDLHERAGSRNVIHMHGELNSAFCVDCGYQGPRHGRLEFNRECPLCSQETLRPDIVLFGEAPRGMPRIDQALSECNLFVAIGTSGQVKPAADFVRVAKTQGAHTVLLNLETFHGATNFDLCQFGEASEIVPSWAAEFYKRPA